MGVSCKLKSDFVPFAKPTKKEILTDQFMDYSPQKLNEVYCMVETVRGIGQLLILSCTPRLEPLSVHILLFEAFVLDNVKALRIPQCSISQPSAKGLPD
ncbi:N-acetyltransferase [Sesbania bispinosa]|nr:N-acetyltransferase [Sesbania bispinosa]